MLSRTTALMVVALALAAAGWALHRAGAQAGRAQVQQQWDEQRREVAMAHNRALLRARERDIELATQAERLQQKHHDETRRIADRYEFVIDGLRRRPETRAGASGVPDAATPGAGCTGAGLARPDGEFLAGYAADAARLQAALGLCAAQYNAARQALSAASGAP